MQLWLETQWEIWAKASLVFTQRFFLWETYPLVGLGIMLLYVDAEFYQSMGIGLDEYHRWKFFHKGHEWIAGYQDPLKPMRVNRPPLHEVVQQLKGLSDKVEECVLYRTGGRWVYRPDLPRKRFMEAREKGERELMQANDVFC